MTDEVRALEVGRGREPERSCARELKTGFNWSGHARILLLTFAVSAVALVLIVAALNPYGNLPWSFTGSHVVMDDNQRFQYPALVREKDYDSVVVGTSTSRLLDPELLDAQFGGRFLNLALNDGRAWEQSQFMHLVQSEGAKLHTLIVGLDVVWCDQRADERRITKRGFPDWMYDANPWNDFPFMLNGKAVEIAGRKLAYHLGLTEARISSRGFEVFVPPDASYDAEKAKRKIWGNRGHRRTAASKPYVASDEERKGWDFPALKWLDADLGALAAQRVILVFMPVHIAAQPRLGSDVAAVETECKSRIAGLARRHDAYLIDFRRHSQLTTRDENYWDNLHYRLPIAGQIIDSLGEALKTGGAAADGTWHVLAQPAGK
ncbi:hypothetical protein SAMN04488061_3309 [Filomicrobium insigne]|uniref:SGNH/GDSL hydrolase family protein n=1 Tax=Filomicrobium insigne TaxID=418854 RepID=A0A1H0TQC2_9HYPH|nr:hypothetical protein [Filomicrobium insigne]SDP55828.1 hypothetical protein SAMN04488061_3309 [Filomicrobium insigne]